MEAYTIFKSLCIIIVAAKLFGIVARKIKVPQVVGEIIAGLVIGPSVLGLVDQSDFLSQVAEIGVVLLMFTAGLGTNLHDLMRTGLKAFAIACAGVLVPLVGGTILYMAIYGFSPWGSPDFYRAVFIGVIMTATSVSITVQALKELGKLSTEVGTTILSAAIIDDVLGIIVLTFVIGMAGGEVQPVSVLLKTVLFFVFAFVVGFIIYKVFRWGDKRWPHTRRIPCPVSWNGLCRGTLFRHCRHHRRLCRGHHFVQHPRLQLHRRKNGHRILYAVRPGIFRKHRLKNHARHGFRRIDFVRSRLYYSCTCLQDYRLFFHGETLPL